MTSTSTPTTIETQQEAVAPASVFAKGLINLLTPVVLEIDTRLQAVFHSQRQLSAQLDLLAAELDKFGTVARTPALSPYVEKLVRVKVRMVAINNNLANIQARLTRMQKENASPTSSPHLPSYTSPTPTTSSPSKPSDTPSRRNSIPPPAATTAPAPTKQPQPVFSSWLNKAKSLVDEPIAKISLPQMNVSVGDLGAKLSFGTSADTSQTAASSSSTSPREIKTSAPQGQEQAQGQTAAPAQEEKTQQPQEKSEATSGVDTSPHPEATTPTENTNNTTSQ
jgi:cytoskeletal protein RodZ